MRAERLDGEVELFEQGLDLERPCARPFPGRAQHLAAAAVGGEVVEELGEAGHLVGLGQPDADRQADAELL